MFWCDECNPHNSGATSGKLHIVKTVRDALAHIDSSVSGNKKLWKSYIIRELAEGKGLPKRVGRKQLLSFPRTPRSAYSGRSLYFYSSCHAANQVR